MSLSQSTDGSGPVGSVVNLDCVAFDTIKNSQKFGNTRLVSNMGCFCSYAWNCDGTRCPLKEQLKIKAAFLDPEQ